MLKMGGQDASSDSVVRWDREFISWRG